MDLASKAPISSPPGGGAILCCVLLIPAQRSAAGRKLFGSSDGMVLSCRVTHFKEPILELQVWEGHGGNTSWRESTARPVREAPSVPEELRVEQRIGQGEPFQRFLVCRNVLECLTLVLIGQTQHLRSLLG